MLLLHIYPHRWGWKGRFRGTQLFCNFWQDFALLFSLVFLIIQFLGFLCTWGVSLLITCYLWSFSAVLDFSLVYYIYFLCSWINFYVHHKHFHFSVRLSVCRSNWYNTKHIERETPLSDTTENWGLNDGCQFGACHIFLIFRYYSMGKVFHGILPSL